MQFVPVGGVIYAGGGLCSGGAEMESPTPPLSDSRERAEGVRSFTCGSRRHFVPEVHIPVQANMSQQPARIPPPPPDGFL